MNHSANTAAMQQGHGSGGGPSTQRLFFSTAYRSQGLNSSAEFELNDNYYSTLRNGFTINLDSVAFMNMRYPTNAYNNKIYFSEAGAATRTATLPVGEYTPATYAAAVQTALNSAGTATYTVTNNGAPTYTLTIASTSTVAFLAGVDSAYRQMGIAANQLSATTAASVTGTNPYLLNPPSVVKVRVQGITLRNYDSTKGSGVLQTPGLTVGFGENVYYTNPDPAEIYVADLSLSRIRFDLTDVENGNREYYLPDSVNVHYVLKITARDGSWEETHPAWKS